MGLHWFDRTPFFTEAHRVLRQPGWLLLYGSGFCGRMIENPEFTCWLEEYLQRFPTPPRSREPLSAEFLAEVGFREVLSETLVHSEIYSLDQLVAHLNTFSNLIGALQDGRETSDTVSSWLRATLAPMFKGPTGTFEYRGWIHVLHKTGDASSEARSESASLSPGQETRTK
jgi:hypothetical protein